MQWPEFKTRYAVPSAVDAAAGARAFDALISGRHTEQQAEVGMRAIWGPRVKRLTRSDAMRLHRDFPVFALSGTGFYRECEVDTESGQKCCVSTLIFRRIDNRVQVEETYPFHQYNAAEAEDERHTLFALESRGTDGANVTLRGWPVYIFE